MAQFLRRQGRDAWALQGGLAAWRAAGYPMEPKAVTAPLPAHDADCPDCDQPVEQHQLVAT
ncbi:MAG: hypothetical protein E6J01_10545 [Chloroflexi bacterium]|nr:MAG: hypothetical protein E6J01_10545 [Chloroflexota bacterium]